MLTFTEPDLLDYYCWFCKNLNEMKVYRLVEGLEDAISFFKLEKQKNEVEELAQKLLQDMTDFIRDKEDECEKIRIPILLSIPDERGEYLRIMDNYHSSKFSLMPELIEYLKDVLGRDFEKLCFMILLKEGFSYVGLTKQSRDRGLDFYAFLPPENRTPFRRMIYRDGSIMFYGEAKTKRRTSIRKSIEIRVLRDVIGSIEHFKKEPTYFFDPLPEDLSGFIPDLIIPAVMSNSDFTPDAKHYAKVLRIRLFDKFSVAACMIFLDIACIQNEDGTWTLDTTELEESFSKETTELEELYGCR